MKKNYLLVFIIYILTFLGVFYFCIVYNKSKVVFDNNISMNSVIKDISEKDYMSIYSNINNYIVENHDFVLYVGSFKSDFDEYNNNLKMFVIDNNLDDQFIYINIDIIDNNVVSKLIADFSDDNIFDDYTIKDVPLFIIFKNGKIHKIISDKYLMFDAVSNKIFDLEVK